MKVMLVSEFHVALKFCQDSVSAEGSNLDATVAAADDGRRKFVLKTELLPCHISVAVAEKIFFVGESIQLFERDRKLESHGAVLKDQESDFYSKLVSGFLVLSRNLGPK